MEKPLAEALQQGAWGMSTGFYPPGSYAKTEELVALAKVLGRSAPSIRVISGEKGAR